MYRAVRCYRTPKGSVVNFTAFKILLNKFKLSSNTLKYYLYGPSPDSATIFNI